MMPRSRKAAERILEVAYDVWRDGEMERWRFGNGR